MGSVPHDANGNVLSKQNGVNASLSELYAYDNLNRLTTFNRGTLNSTHDAIATASTLAGSARSWSLDALGNQTSTLTDGTSTSRASNQQNELTQVGSNTLAYDGNLIIDEKGHTLVYDAWNHLVGVKNGTIPLATYSYDATGRRITEVENGVTTNLYASQQLDARWLAEHGMIPPVAQTRRQLCM